MTQSAQLLARGWAQLLADMGEQVTFRRRTVAALVAARDVEMDLETGGWRAGSTFSVELPDVFTPRPAPREQIELRGSLLTIRTVTNPHPAKPAVSLVCETP